MKINFKNLFIFILITALTALPAILFTGCGILPVIKPANDGDPVSAVSEASEAEISIQKDLFTESKTEAENNENNIAETATENEAETYLDKLAKDVLESVKNGDYKETAEYMGASDAEAYRFIGDMTVDSYEIAEAEDLAGGLKYFKVKFNISKSDNKYFSAGESYWDLIVGGMRSVGLFRPSDDKIRDYYLKGVGYDKDYNFCYSFSLNLGIFQTAADFNTVVGDSTAYWGSLVHGIIHFYVETAPNAKWDVPYDLDAVKDYMIKTTGITNADYANYAYYNKDDNSLNHDGHGGSWLYWLPVGKEYGENAKVYTAVIDYYADTALLAVAKTMEYKYTVNDDGTYKMLSTELLYDSGYSMQIDGI